MMFSFTSMAAMASVPVFYSLDRPLTVALLLVGLLLYQVYLRAIPRRRSTPLTQDPQHPIRLRAGALQGDLL